MSLSSKLRKENDESFASKQRQSTQGLAPDQGLTQLNDIQRDNDLPSRQMDVNDTNFADDYEDIKVMAADSNNENDGPSDVDIEESKRASWGQPPLPADADDASTDEDSPMTAYQHPTQGVHEADKVADADWNRSTAEGAIPTTRTNEPDRTLGNS
ncbi:hypothetical protein ACFSUS_08780 [Spirosoma soli]|uniref:Uncharacterized protein n=1 Tax=Spirosoma soli TaxID=1770529 RepID=A0ABW5M111_9BACT